MTGTLKYFFTAIILISSVKLIQISLYDELKPTHPKDKVYRGESDTNEPGENKTEIIPDLAEIAKIDTLNQESEEGQDQAQVEEKEPIEQSEGDSRSEVQASESASVNETPRGDEYFQSLKNSYLSPILASLPEGRSRDDVVIRYYKHESDAKKIYALRSLGYYLHEREAEDNIDLESNILYYGRDVDLRDIKLVAYTLLQNGVSLKSIQPSSYDWKYNALEIGADALVQNNPTLQISDIETFVNQ